MTELTTVAPAPRRKVQGSAQAGPALLASATAPVPSRVDPEASGCLVAPPVFKTGERRAAALAGSIPVRLRHLRKRAQPRELVRMTSCWVARVIAT
jgi:hypothetical protein